MTSLLRRKRQTIPQNILAAKAFKGRSLWRTALALVGRGRCSTWLPSLALVAAMGLSPALHGDDQVSISSDSSLHLIADPAATASAQPAASRTESPAAPPPLFSRSKWSGPAVVAPRVPDLKWKGAFHANRLPSAADESRVVQASGELPQGVVRPVVLPTPPRMGLSDRPELTPPVQPQGVEPPDSAPSVTREEAAGSLLPTLERQLSVRPSLIEKCASPRDLKSIRNITADISVRPEDTAGSKRLPPECSLGDTPFEQRKWRRIDFAWTAAGTSHYPIYFDDEQLERYGHSFGPVRQPIVSAVRFFGTVPLLPYYMGVYPANECIYDLGQYRPGSCAPFYLDPFPLSVRGAFYEGMFLGALPVAF